MTKQEEGILESQLKYPIFCCSSGGSSKLVAVGGGGGKSKTGVPNGIALYKWSGIKLLPQGEYSTTDCVPNIAFHPNKDIFAYILGQQCHIIEVKCKADSETAQFIHKVEFDLIPATNSTTSKTTKKTEKSKNNNEETKKSSEEEPDDDSIEKKKPNNFEQYNIRFSPSGDRIVTSGSDGTVRIWETQNYKLIKEFTHCHLDEINSIDINHANTHMATTSKDKSCKIWNILSGRLEHTLKYSHEGQDLEFRGCRFVSGGLSLITVQFRPNTRKVKGCTFVTRWDTNTGKRESTRQIHSMHNTCMELSGDGTSLAVGTSDSLVTVVDSLGFKRLDRWEPHDFVITGLAYSPDNQAVLSVSANYSLKSHKIGTGTKELDYKLLFILALLILIASIIYSFLL